MVTIIIKSNSQLKKKIETEIYFSIRTGKTKKSYHKSRKNIGRSVIYPGKSKRVPNSLSTFEATLVLLVVL